MGTTGRSNAGREPSHDTRRTRARRDGTPTNADPLANTRLIDYLQRTVGNQAVSQLVQRLRNDSPTSRALLHSTDATTIQDLTDSAARDGNDHGLPSTARSAAPRDHLARMTDYLQSFRGSPGGRAGPTVANRLTGATVVQRGIEPPREDEADDEERDREEDRDQFASPGPALSTPPPGVPRGAGANGSPPPSTSLPNLATPTGPTPPAAASTIGSTTGAVLSPTTPSGAQAPSASTGGPAAPTGPAGPSSDQGAAETTLPSAPADRLASPPPPAGSPPGGGPPPPPNGSAGAKNLANTVTSVSSKGPPTSAGGGPGVLAKLAGETSHPGAPNGKQATGPSAGPGPAPAPPVAVPGLPAPGPAALPGSPLVAEAARQIQQAADREKTLLRQTTMASRLNLLAQVEQRAQAILNLAQSKTQALTVSIDNRKGEIQRTFAARRDALQREIASRQDTARADGEKSLLAASKEVDERRDAATKAAEQHALQVIKTGDSEGDRATNAATGHQGQIIALGNQKANGATVDDKARQAVSQAVGQAASQTADKVLKNGQDVAQKARDAAAKAADSVRASGAKVAAGIGDNLGKVQQSIQQSIDGAVDHIASAGAEQLRALASMEEQTVGSLEKLKSATLPSILQAGQTAANQVRQSGQAAAQQFEQMDARNDAVLDGAANKIVDALASREARRPIPQSQLTSITTVAGQKLAEVRAMVEQGLDEQVTAAENGLGKIESAFSNNLGQIDQKVDASITQTISKVDGGLGDLEKSFADAAEQILTSARDGATQAVDKFSSGIEQKIAEADRGWATGREKVEGEIRSKVDTGIKGQQDVVAQAPAQLDAVAKDAQEKADGGIWAGIWKAIGGFVSFAIKVLEIAIPLFLLLMALGIVAFAAVDFLIVVGIVAAAFLVIDWIKAIVKRYEQMDKALNGAPWYIQFLAGFAIPVVALLDVLGVTGLYEAITDKDIMTGEKLNLTDEQKSERVTAFILGVVLFFILHEATKGAGEGGEGDGEGGGDGDGKGGDNKGSGDNKGEDNGNGDDPNKKAPDGKDHLQDPDPEEDPATTPGGRTVPLANVRYSQKSASFKMSDGRTIDDVANDMRAKGWDTSQPSPDMVDWGDGGFETLDHRRLIAADQAGISDVPANIHLPGEALPPGLQARFTFKKTFTDPVSGKTFQAGDTPKTWGEAAMGRAASQGASFPLRGSPSLPKVTGKPK